MTKEEFDNLPRICLSCEKSETNPKNIKSKCDAYDRDSYCRNSKGTLIKCVKYVRRENVYNNMCE